MDKTQAYYVEELERYFQKQEVNHMLKTIKHIIHFYDFSNNELFMVATVLKNISYALRDTFESRKKKYKRIDNYITEELEKCQYCI